MLFSWMRARRRRALGDLPFPGAWHDILRRGVKQSQWLEDEETEQLRRWIAVFLAEKRFEGCRGLEITDEIRVTVAGQAGIVALGFGGEWFGKSMSLFAGT